MSDWSDVYWNKGTTGTTDDNQITMDKMLEAMELIKVLSPKESPDDASLVKGVTGLKIVKNNMLPADTVIVSKRLFDLIWSCLKETE